MSYGESRTQGCRRGVFVVCLSSASGGGEGKGTPLLGHRSVENKRVLDAFSRMKWQM